MTEEIWKAIEGFEGLYEVSNLGRVRSLDRTYPNNYRPHKGIIKKFALCGGRGHNKYPTVGLQRVNPKFKTGALVHRLVAKAFIPNPDNKPEVNHIDGNKLNNHVDNLEWCTRKENVQHSSDNGLLRCDGVHFNAKLNVANVVQIKKELANGTRKCAIAKKYNVEVGTVYAISYNKSWRHVTI